MCKKEKKEKIKHTHTDIYVGYSKKYQRKLEIYLMTEFDEYIRHEIVIRK